MQTKFVLDENEMPKKWYNIIPDLKNKPAPVLHPVTKKPVSPKDLAPIFPMEIIKQEVSDENFIRIPDEVLDVYRLWRPSPLYRAYRLEKMLKSPAKIFYKYEGCSPVGSHKPNTAVAQAYYNMKEGVERITTETGAGQWGSSLSFACNLFGLKCLVYMVKVSYEQKPYRKIMMNTYGAEVIASPSKTTECGKKILAENPDCSGSLGIAISEAVEVAVKDEKTKYSLGSVLNHVLMHQTIIGQEAEKQLSMAEVTLDFVIGCVGGGSNFAGMAFPLMKKFPSARFVAVEPESCPSITKGEYAYDYGDSAGLTPLVKMYTLGHNFMPPAIHAGGLRYHGMAPLISQLCAEGSIEARAVSQTSSFEVGVMFARAEGIIPAPESTHAIRVAIDEALNCKKSGEDKTILFNLSGHGYFDLASYEKYLRGELKDYSHPIGKIKDLPKI